MEDIVEKIGNVNLNIDSETARAIADQYVTLKYVQHWTVVVILAVVFAPLMFYLAKMLKKMIEEDT
jgi:hypothetical protein